MTDLGLVLAALSGGADEGILIADAGMAAGDEIHHVLRRHATALPTVRAAIGMSVHVTAQMLCETMSFGDRSVDGGEDGRTLKDATFKLFMDLVEQHEPDVVASWRRSAGH